MNWKIMNLQQFRNHAQELFYRKSTGPVNQPERLISFVTILFEQTVLKGRKWIGRDEVARLQYEKNDGKDYLERVKQSEKRLRTRLNELEVDGREIGFRFLDNKETGNVVSNSKGRPTRGYRLELIGKTANATIKSDGIHLGKFAGRDEQVSQFRELLDRFDDPSRERHVLPFYGFGGVGKSSLLEILRNEALTAGVNVMPTFIRDQVVTGDTDDWLSEVFLFAYRKETRPTQRWRDFLDVLEPNTVVFVDTTKDVHMGKFNRTMGTLNEVLQREGVDALIVTATRTEPTYKLTPKELTGLTETEVSELVKVEGWPNDIDSFSDKLVQQTDGNPFILESICRNEELWTVFKNEGLDLTSRAKPVVHLLKEMWKALSDDGKKALTVVATLAHHAPAWDFTWGYEECMALLGPGWEDTSFELTGKCFIHEETDGRYRVHELVSDFARRRLDDKPRMLRRMADHYSSTGDEMAAMMFFTEADTWLRKG